MRIEIDPRRPTPPSEQIADQVRFAIASGRLRPGEKLPSVRKLAAQAIVNPNTVARSYRELERDGAVETRPGSGVYVARGAVARCRQATRLIVAERLGCAIDESLAAGLAPSDIESLVSRRLQRCAEGVNR